MYNTQLEYTVMLVMKSSKRHLTDEMELPNQEKIRKLGENETQTLGHHRD